MHNAARPLIAKVMDLLLDAVCVVDREGCFVLVSAACERIFGYSADELIGRPMIDLVHPDDRAATLQAAAEVMAGLPKAHFRNRYLRKDGEVAHIMWSARWSEADQVRIAVARDVTELSRAESFQSAVYAISEAAHATSDLFSLIARIQRIVTGLLPGGDLLVALCDDLQGDLHFADAVETRTPSAQARRLLAEQHCREVIAAGHVLPLSRHEPSELSLPLDRRQRCSWLGVPLRSQARVIGALVMQGHSGEACYSGKDQELLQFVSVQIAVAIERKRNELRLQHIALHDSLTNLPNRELFNDRLRLALARAQRYSVGVALLYIDLDGFKQINDRWGHATGDQLLCEVAQRLGDGVREADTVARVGGDEFIVLLECFGDIAQATEVAEKIRSALERPFQLGNHRLQISSSIGIAIHPQHGADAVQLLSRADEAMYGAKQLGKNRVLLGNAELGVDRLAGLGATRSECA